MAAHEAAPDPNDASASGQLPRVPKSPLSADLAPKPRATNPDRVHVIAPEDRVFEYKPPAKEAEAEDDALRAEGRAGGPRQRGERVAPAEEGPHAEEREERGERLSVGDGGEGGRGGWEEEQDRGEEGEVLARGEGDSRPAGRSGRGGEGSAKASAFRLRTCSSAYLYSARTAPTPAAQLTTTPPTTASLNPTCPSHPPPSIQPTARPARCIAPGRPGEKASSCSYR